MLLLYHLCHHNFPYYRKMNMTWLSYFLMSPNHSGPVTSLAVSRLDQLMNTLWVSQSWECRAVSEAVARLLWWMCTLHFSLESVAINKIVPSSSPGGQWLQFWGHDAVPLRTASFLLIRRFWVQIPRHPKKFHIKIIMRKLFPKICFFKLTGFFQF